MTLFEARGEALKQLAAQGYSYDWPGHIVARISPAGGGDGICFAVPMEDAWSSSARFMRELSTDWSQPSYWKVFLETRIVAWRWWDRWRWRTDRLYVYSLTDDDHEAFLRFCDAGSSDPDIAR